MRPGRRRSSLRHRKAPKLHRRATLNSSPSCEYGVPVASAAGRAGDREMERVRRVHTLRSYRVVSVLRIGVLAFVVGAMVVATPVRSGVGSSRSSPSTRLPPSAL